MRDSDWIRETLNGPLGADEVRRLAKEMPALRLLELISDEDEKVARNAAWVLTHMPIEEIRKLPQERLIDFAMATGHPALRRMTLNLIAQQKIDKEDIRTDFLDFCLRHMTLLEEPPGVQSLCLKLAQQMCRYYPELTHEFEESVKLLPAEQFKPGVRYLLRRVQGDPEPTKQRREEP